LGLEPLFDDFPLFVAEICGDDTLVAKSQELNEIVEPFAYSGGMINASSQFGFAHSIIILSMGAVSIFDSFLAIFRLIGR